MGGHLEDCFSTIFICLLWPYPHKAFERGSREFSTLFELFGYVELQEKSKDPRKARKKASEASEGKAREQQRKMTSRRRKKE
jgi:hypothetical protein